MKKSASVLVLIAMISNLFLTSCYATENIPVTDPVIYENGQEMINDTLFTWISTDEIVSMGMLCPDGTLTVSWFYPNSNMDEVYELLVPADLVAEIPTTPNGTIDLQYIIDNVITLNLQINTLPIEELSLTFYGANPLMENTVRALIESVYSTDTYRDRVLVQSNRYSGVTIKVLETKNFEMHYAGKGDTGITLKEGTSVASAALQLANHFLWPQVAALSYLSNVLGFASNFIPEDVTIEAYAAAFQYSRTSSYKGSNDSSFLYTPIEEVKLIQLNVAINYSEAGPDTFGYPDITHFAGDPIITYLSSEQEFSENAIIEATYDYYNIMRP